jgi:hypothetical protein
MKWHTANFRAALVHLIFLNPKLYTSQRTCAQLAAVLLILEINAGAAPLPAAPAQEWRGVGPQRRVPLASPALLC